MCLALNCSICQADFKTTETLKNRQAQVCFQIKSIKKLHPPRNS